MVRLITAQLLTHYDTNLPLKLAADASQYGLGLLSHTFCQTEKRDLSLLHRVHCLRANRTTLKLTKSFCSRIHS